MHSFKSGTCRGEGEGSHLNRLSENVVSWFFSRSHKKWVNAVAKQKFKDRIKLNEINTSNTHQAVKTIH